MLELKPNDLQAHYKFFEIYYKLEEYDKALEYADKIIQLDPSPSNYMNKGHVLFQAGKYSEAVNALNRGDTRLEGLHYRIGICELILNDFDKAVFHLRKFLKLPPLEDHKTNIWLINTIAAMRRDISPLQYFSFLTLATLYHLDGKSIESDHSIYAAQKMFSNDPNPDYFYVIAIDRFQNEITVEKYLSDLKAFDHVSKAEAYLVLAYSLIREGNNQRATEYLKKCQEIEDSDKYYKDIAATLSHILSR